MKYGDPSSGVDLTTLEMGDLLPFGIDIRDRD